MKKVWMILTIILALTIAGCSNSANNPSPDHTEKKSVIDKSVESDSDSSWIKDIVFEEPDQRNVESNLIAGRAVEDNSVIIFNNYTYDKNTGEVSLLCKNPVCDHNLNNCIIYQYYSFQIYEDNILCCDSNGIYLLDAETGELSKIYDTDMEIYAFKMIGKDTALIHTPKGFYVMNFKSGQKKEILNGEIHNAFYTNDHEYLYISMENSELHRVRLDGTEDKKLKEKTGWPIIYKDTIFYANWRDEEWSLKSINKNGGDEKVVLDDMSTYSVYNGKIYYFTASYPRKAMMCDIDGQNKKELLDGDGRFYIYPQSGKAIVELFDNHKGYEYKIMNLDGSDMKDLEVPSLE